MHIEVRSNDQFRNHNLHIRRNTRDLRHFVSNTRMNQTERSRFGLGRAAPARDRPGCVVTSRTMTEKKLIGLLVGAFVCAAVFTFNPTPAGASGDVGTPGGQVPSNAPHGSTPAGALPVPERPVPAPEKILPASPPGGGFLCPTP